MIQGIVIRVIVLALLSASAVSQNIQSRSETLLQRAREIEDIRSPAASPFRLRATFSFAGDDLDPVEGNYAETWISSSKWRQEIVVGDLEEIAVGGSGKHWVLFPDAFPSQADKVAAILNFIPPAGLRIDFGSVAKLAGRDLTAECAYTNANKHRFRSAFCFDEQTGVLLQKVFPAVRPHNVVSFSCAYGSFRSFQKYVFPRAVSCFEDQHKAIRVNIVELSPAPAEDPVFFDPPAGAIEIPECSGEMTSPFMVSSQFAFSLQADTTAHVPVWFMVNVEDKPESIRVLKRIGKDSYAKVVQAVRALNFEHGTCNGEPMAMPVSLQVSISSNR